jgi:hypothetical protein
VSKFTGRVCGIYGGIVLIILLFHNSFGQTQNKDILDRKIDLDIKGNLFQLCVVLASLKEIPVGLEGAADFSSGEDKSIQIQPGTLREILDSIVKQEPKYVWELRDGVINFYPASSRDAILKALLETKIKSFSSKKDAGRVGIRDNILRLEPVKALLTSKQIRLGFFTSARLDVKDETADINISNTDLKGLLNKVVYDSGDSKLWTIQRVPDGNILLTF